MMKSPRSAGRRHLPTSPFPPPSAAPPIEKFAPQDLVTHDKYGLGHVVEAEPGGAVLVDFGSEKVRILAPYVRLFKL
jgi:hypothetical protein